MTADYRKSTAESEIRELIDARAKAIREKNANAILSTYAPDVVMYNLAPPLQTRGPDRKMLETWFASYQGAMGCEKRDLNISASDSVAFCNYLFRITGTSTEGKAEDMWVRATLGFNKTGGQWLITHEHNSEPFDMQTFKALLDLKP